VGLCVKKAKNVKIHSEYIILFRALSVGDKITFKNELHFSICTNTDKATTTTTTTM